MPVSQTTLKGLIVAGLLHVGDELRCEPRKGEIYKSQLKVDGSINYMGRDFRSPSAWAGHVAGGARNGWELVSVRGRKLSHFRQELAGESTLGPEPQPTVIDPEPDESQDQSNIDSGRLWSAISRLNSQMESQQREIKNLNAKMEIPPIATFEDDKEDVVLRNLHDRILDLSPGQFEMLVGEYMKYKGFSEVVVSGRTGDGGIDGYCEIPFVKVKVAFQAKRYATGSNVGIEPVQRLVGSMSSGFDRGLFITTSDFTIAAKGWVDETEAQVTLINGEELVRQMVDLGMGVRRTPVVRYELDIDFFTGLEQ